jgi:putative ABC transport system permease protein
MLTDFRDALRGLRAGRGTTALALVILTLTLAAGTVTFSVVDAVALRSLPFSQSDRLVAIAHLPRPDGALEGSAPQDYFSWRDSVRSFEAVAGAWGGGLLRLDVAGAAVELRSARATPNLFDVLRVQPVLGRLFRPEEDTPGHNTVLVLSHAAWTRTFGADPTVIGRRIAVTEFQSTATYEIIGVLPPGITYPVTAARPVDVFRPYVATAAERDHASRGRSYGFHVVGRLRPGVTVEQARADVERVNAAVRAAYPGNLMVGSGTVVLSLHDRVVGPAKSWLLLVLAAVACVVIVGCVNAASLLLARAAVRTRELATRAALGASRDRLAGTLLLEGFLLACTASVTAVLLSFWGVEFAKARLPENLARVSTIAIDARVLIASTAAAVLCGLFAGGAPAWRVARHDLFEHMKFGGAVIGGRRQQRSLGAFLVAEVALVTILLVATTLVVTSFIVVTTADLGFDRHDVMTIDVSKPMQDVAKSDRQAVAAVLFAEVLDRVRAVPGVKAAGLVSSGSAPLSGNSVRYSVVIPGVGDLRGTDSFETRGVSPEYFSAMGLRLVRGRSFDANDGPGAPAVAIINDLAARRYFPGRDPVGQIVTFREQPTRIVGVTANVRLHGPEADWRSEIYVPLAQEPPSIQGIAQQLVVRTAGPAPALAPEVSEAIRPALGGRTVPQPRFVEDDFRRLTADRRFNAGVMSVLGVLAIVIGAMGIYGTMAFVVAQQSRAIGLCMALGASQANVLRSILRQSLWRVGIGTVLGIAGARAVASLFTSLVFGIETTSPAVYAGVAIALAAIGLFAAFVPARRAARLDPLLALRAE